MLTVRKGAYNPGTNQTFTSSGSSQYSAAVGSSTTIIRVATNADVYVVLGTGNPTATSSNLLIPAGGVEFFVAQPGQTQVAFLAVGTGGQFTVTELA